MHSEVAGHCHVLECLKHGRVIAGVELLLIYFVFIQDLIYYLLLFLVNLVDTDEAKFDGIVAEDFFVDQELVSAFVLVVNYQRVLARVVFVKFGFINADDLYLIILRNWDGLFH